MADTSRAREAATAGQARPVPSSNRRIAGALASGVVGTVVMGLVGGWNFAALVGWDAAAIVLVATTWSTVGSMDAESTARYALREEPGRAITDLLLVFASVASLLGVGFVIVAGGNTHGAKGGFLVGVAILTVVVSWSIVHTTFMLRYARLYYSGPDGGVQFKSPDAQKPSYADFAYLSFTIGMTFQVSDTDLTSSDMRRTALRHALLSYVFGVVIIAVMINLVAGLSK